MISIFDMLEGFPTKEVVETPLSMDLETWKLQAGDTFFFTGEVYKAKEMTLAQAVIEIHRYGKCLKSVISMSEIIGVKSLVAFDSESNFVRETGKIARCVGILAEEAKDMRAVSRSDMAFWKSIFQRFSTQQFVVVKKEEYRDFFTRGYNEYGKPSWMRKDAKRGFTQLHIDFA